MNHYKIVKYHSIHVFVMYSITQYLAYSYSYSIFFSVLTCETISLGLHGCAATLCLVRCCLCPCPTPKMTLHHYRDPSCYSIPSCTILHLYSYAYFFSYYWWSFSCMLSTHFQWHIQRSHVRLINWIPRKWPTWICRNSCRRGHTRSRSVWVHPRTYCRIEL